MSDSSHRLIEEFLEAIKPNVIVNIQPGYYNLSKYIEDAWVNEGEEWNNKYPYLRIRECFDGVELHI